MIEALLTFNITSCGIRIESHQAYPDCTPSSHLTLILQGTIKSLSLSTHLFHFLWNLLIVYLKLRRRL